MRSSLFILAGIVLTISATRSAVAQGDFVGAVTALNPTAYWRLGSNNSSSQVNGYTTTYHNGASTSGAGQGAPLNGYPTNHAATFDFTSPMPQYISTSLSGGINGSGTMIVWINLGSLPSASGSTFYIAGESQVGNDFDLQIQSDNKIYFYTGAGENTSFAPAAGTLVNQWNFLAVTFDSTAGTRDIYWNGSLAASFTGAVNGTAKTNAFTIGSSTVFPGRDFNGDIDEVAVFNYALTGAQVSQLYFSAVPEPQVWLLLGGGVLAILLVPRWKAKLLSLRCAPVRREN